MVSDSPKPTTLPLTARTPTEYLTAAKIEHLSQLNLYLMAKEGFALEDVQLMISTSELYSSMKILKQIVQKAGRASLARSVANGPVRLNAQQSAMVFQFANVLEQAIAVFGNQRYAEEWLSRPCIHLAGNVPIDLVENSLGYEAVRAYLERVKLGIYQ